jgi:phosphoglycolate phosphatase
VTQNLIIAGANLTIRGILFDKDGTLIDFDQTWMPAYHAALDDLCDPLSDPDIKNKCLVASGYDIDRGCTVPNSALAVEGSDDIAMIWLEAAGQPSEEAAVNRLVKIMEQYSADHPVPLFDVASLFKRLVGRNLTLGVATMDAEWVARRSMDKLSASAHIQFYAGYDSGFGRKPGPGMVHKFCDNTKLQPDQIIVVGDNLHDLHMSISAGAALAVGVCSGVASRDDLAGVANHVIEDAREIEGLLEQLN